MSPLQPRTDGAGAELALAGKKAAADSSEPTRGSADDQAQVTWGTALPSPPRWLSEPQSSQTCAQVAPRRAGGVVRGTHTAMSCWSLQYIKPDSPQRHSVCIPGPICHAPGQCWHMGGISRGQQPPYLLHQLCPWSHDPQLPLAARMDAGCTITVSPPVWLTRFSLLWQVEAGTPGSRNATAPGTAEMALPTSVSRAGLKRWGSR